MQSSPNTSATEQSDIAIWYRRTGVVPMYRQQVPAPKSRRSPLARHRHAVYLAGDHVEKQEHTMDSVGIVERRLRRQIESERDVVTPTDRVRVHSAASRVGLPRDVPSVRLRRQDHKRHQNADCDSHCPKTNSHESNPPLRNEPHLGAGKRPNDIVGESDSAK